MLSIPRAHAFALHLAITAVLLLVPAWLVASLWYPDFFLSADGGIRGLQLLAGVQLVVGPVLTLALFKPGKKGLLSDVILIVILQVGCLVGGTWILYSQRPLFLVFYEGEFYSANEDTYERHGMTPPDWHQFADRPPATVVAKLPDNPIEEQGFRRVLYSSNIPLWVYPRTYKPLSARMITAETGIAVDTLRQRDRLNALDSWVESHGGTLADYAFVRMVGRFREDVLLGVRRSSGVVVGRLDIDPPPRKPPELMLPLP